MLSAAAPDLSSLARLAQHPDAELRPLLLRVQARTFADAPRRDLATIARFETIALGLIALVPDDVLSEIAASLRGVPETPPSVSAALAARLIQTVEEDAGSTPVDGEPESLAIAKDLSRPVAGHRLDDLVDEARTNAELAAALLDRPEPTGTDRADLYRYADQAERDRIREDLNVSLTAGSPAGHRLPAPAHLREILFKAAETGQSSSVHQIVSAHIGLPEVPGFDLDTDPGRELFVCALLAFGLEATECIRVVLTLDATMARSVPTVFRLAAIARSTPMRVAAHLVGSEDRPGRQNPRQTARPPETAVIPATGMLRADGRSDQIIDRRRVRDLPGSELSVRAGHRWRSTTGPDRT